MYYIRPQRIIAELHLHYSYRYRGRTFSHPDSDSGARYIPRSFDKRYLLVSQHLRADQERVYMLQYNCPIEDNYNISY